MYKHSQTHSTQEEPGKYWFVVDTMNKRVGFGFMDFETENQAMAVAVAMNAAYDNGLQAAWRNTGGDDRYQPSKDG